MRLCSWDLAKRRSILVLWIWADVLWTREPPRPSWDLKLSAQVAFAVFSAPPRIPLPLNPRLVKQTVHSVCYSSRRRPSIRDAAESWPSTQWLLGEGAVFVWEGEGDTILTEIWGLGQALHLLMQWLPPGLILMGTVSHVPCPLATSARRSLYMFKGSEWRSRLCNCKGQQPLLRVSMEPRNRSPSPP